MPPKRATSVIPEGTEEENTLRLLEQRRTEVLEKRARDQVAELERELAGGARASSMAITGEEQAELPSRSISESLSSSRDRARALPPPVYTAASLGELRKHIQGAVVYFDAIGEHEVRRRVAVAASYCREEALSQWTRLAEKPSTWFEYERVLRDMIQDPANRMGSALLSLKRVQQREGQSIRELSNYIEELEEDVPELSAEQQRAWTLLNSLQLELRAAVLREERTIRTRGQVISTAQRLQELGVVVSESQSKRKRVDSEVYRSREREPQLGRKAQMMERLCYACDKPGHVAKDCPSKKKEKSSAIHAVITEPPLTFSPTLP
jgi:Zinc knuckle